MDIFDDMEVSKLSAKVFLKVNYSYNEFPHCKLPGDLVSKRNRMVMTLHY